MLPFRISFLFAWRYFKAKKSTQAINIISWISSSAIAIGTASMILVLSIFNGFENLVTSLYNDFYTDIRITAQQGKTFSLTPSQFYDLQNIPGVTALSGVAEEKAILVNGEMQTIIYLKGVNTEYSKVASIEKHIVRGLFDLGSVDTPKIVIGAGIENAVLADVSPTSFPLTIYLPAKNTTLHSDVYNNGLHAANIIPTGTFFIQQELDNEYAFTNLSFMQYMLDLKKNEYTAIEIHTQATCDILELKKNIEHILGPSFKIQTRYQQNQSLYMVMQTEKWIIFIILSLILAIAAFNIIGTLTMLVLEKQKDIQILKVLGASNTQIQYIFLAEGFLMGVIGATIGTIISIILCLLQTQFKWIKLGNGTFIIDYYPVKMQVTDFLFVFAVIFFIVMAASWWPARKASKSYIHLKSSD